MTCMPRIAGRSAYAIVFGVLMLVAGVRLGLHHGHGAPAPA